MSKAKRAPKTRSPQAVAIGQRIREALDEYQPTRANALTATRLSRSRGRPLSDQPSKTEIVAELSDLSTNHLYVLMRGEAMPGLPSLGRLAKTLGVTRDWLEGRSGAAKRRQNGNGKRNGNGGRG